MARSPHKWVICYIDIKKMHLLSVDLRKQAKYESVRSYIPEVKVLKKKLKGKNHFDKLPLLFNYGFFKVPKYFIPNPYFLEQMKKDIRCIYGWVMDPLAKSNHQPVLEYGKYSLYNPMGVALATDEEMAKIKVAETTQSIYTAKDIDTLYIGKQIILKKYPFEGLPAEIYSIDKHKKEVMVKLMLDTPLSGKPIRVAFENIFWSVYQTYLNPEPKEESIEDLRMRYKNFEGKNEEQD